MFKRLAKGLQALTPEDWRRAAVVSLLTVVFGVVWPNLALAQALNVNLADRSDDGAVARAVDRDDDDLVRPDRDRAFAAAHGHRCGVQPAELGPDQPRHVPDRDRDDPDLQCELCGGDQAAARPQDG
eukprot:gene21716-26844_t